MKFFEAVPGELFSPLASPNRALYADALDVLYTAYQDKLKIPEDTFYSMLRSRLEQQLADATFEGEDIDEDELRDISGRARFLIRNGDSIFFLYDFRQDRFFHRGGIALIGESRSSHADAQHRRYQQCAEFLNLHH